MAGVGVSVGVVVGVGVLCVWVRGGVLALALVNVGVPVELQSRFNRVGHLLIRE